MQISHHVSTKCMKLRLISNGSLLETHHSYHSCATPWKTSTSGVLLNNWTYWNDEKMANTTQDPQFPDKVWVSHPTDPTTQSNESPACHHRCKRAPPSAKGDEVPQRLNERGAWSLVNDWNGQSHHCSDMLTAGRQRARLSILVAEGRCYAWQNESPLVFY